MSSFIFADRFVLPETSPLLSPRLHRLFYVSLALQHAAFHLVSNTWLKGEGKEMLKKRCWILTTMASAVMCAASLPYLADLARSGFDLHQLRPRTATVAEPLAAYFVAYLVSDLGLGSIYYRSMINLSSGWVHHIGYIFLFSWWVHRGWAHLAATAAIFELPTLIMGLASIHPPLRSNNAFTATFFATRIFYHFALALASCTEYGRSMPGVGGSWGPVVSMIVTYPMHVWWGYKCILSVRRRMRKRKLAAREVQSAKASLAASAGQLLTGLPAPDVSSAVNTPATTPGAGAVPATANFGSTGPVHTAFAKAASMARPPVNLLLPKSRRRSADAVGGAAAGPSAAAVSDEQLLKQAPLLNRRLSSKYINTQSVFTAPVAPDGAKPDDAEPFLAIRSPAEASDRARRLVADAVRKVWLSAPAKWRRQFEEEANLHRRDPRLRPNAALHRSISSSSSSSAASSRSSLDSSSEDVDDDAAAAAAAELAAQQGRTKRYLAAQKARARRAVLRAVRTAINGRDADGLGGGRKLGVNDDDVDGIADGYISATFADGAVSSAATTVPSAVDRTLLRLDFSSLIAYLPPDFFGQDYEIREYPVEREVEGGRRSRIVGQIRRRMEVARRDMVVF
ncbi:uncharacterized protein PSFLO_03977 [Pseudozyma flocculosa]|uniref:TLC domain-containing protein n=1 Tax=Pseudozyma flocculosa TaxID=84751 RepID=A0A5C3F511_9BASI|nr:uncharacterized protein PSFLO_03977 [Pseudozyma flocculosa]